MWLFIGLMVFTVIAMGVTTGLTPYFSRRATPFGISVPVDELKSVFLKTLCNKMVKKIPKFIIVFIYSVICIMASIMSRVTTHS